jgi:hypothetical protein
MVAIDAPVSSEGADDVESVPSAVVGVGDACEPRATVDALRCRDIGRLFRLLSQYGGASQTRLAIASDMTQPKVSGIMRGIARVETLEVFERIADGLNMPSQARVALGLAPKANQADAQPAAARQPEHPGPDIPPGDARAALPDSAVPDLFSADFKDWEEEEDHVRRRTGIGSTPLSPSATREPPSTWRARSIWPRSR